LQIETLYNEMEGIKQLQSVLNHELDFVNAHQQEINQYIDQVKAKATANPQDRVVRAGQSCHFFLFDRVMPMLLLVDECIPSVPQPASSEGNDRREMVQLFTSVNNQLNKVEMQLTSVIDTVNASRSNVDADSAVCARPLTDLETS
jgi:hypothetical protein